MFGRSRRNLARWFTLSMGSILIVFAGLLYYVEIVDELDKLDRLLYQKTRVMATNANYEFQKGELDLENVPLLGSNTRLLNTEMVYARWYSPSEQLVQFFGTPAPEELKIAPGFDTIKTTVPWIRQVTLPVYQESQLIGYLQVGTPLTSTQESLAQLRLVLTLAVPVTLGIIGITGWFLGGVAMQPIRYSYEQLHRFTANASHELRAPLAAVLSNAQVGLLSPVGDGSQQRLRLEKIVDVTKSMSSLVSNLLLLARHERPLDPKSLNAVDLTSLLKEIADIYTIQAAAVGLSLSSHLPWQPLYLPADPDLLRQVVTNLLSNACKYTPGGGKIQLRLFTRSHQAVIQVEDSGIGIGETDLPHVFEGFYRVHTERSKYTGGFGLGLAIAMQIVTAHRGTLTASSVVGQGTTFTIKLPM
jgi:OmpR-family two-component system manganese-sensing sensor histidine kinase